MTGSLLGGADRVLSPEEEDGEDNSCPPLLAVPPVSQRLQSTLHCIDLSVQQVDPLIQSKDQNPRVLLNILKFSLCLSNLLSTVSLSRGSCSVFVGVSVVEKPP